MASQIFLFNQQTYPDGDACFGAISTAKANGKAKYWGVLSPEYNKDGNVMVKCAHCGFLLSPSNVSPPALLSAIGAHGAWCSPSCATASPWTVPGS
jgi:hypothetical protein